MHEYSRVHENLAMTRRNILYGIRDFRIFMVTYDSLLYFIKIPICLEEKGTVGDPD
jgi:hypothetical protein